ncbi:CBS domain-containing protein [Actinoplanes sp. NPDC049596]|uniref:CBS domain-containing protein n=1 Tax=unclassified Actinoplanes TaxID=2626549 RepID=UPI0034330CF2
MRAKDVMTTPVLTVAPTAPVEDAATLLTTNGVTALPVVAPTGGAATITGPFPTDTDRTVVTTLTRTVPGVTEVYLESPRQR